MPKYGWIPDVPDLRDFRYTPKFRATVLPSKVDLRRDDLLLPVYDQSTLGSCSANSTSKAFAYRQRVQADTDPVEPSRLFLYYNTRILEGTVRFDSGAQIRNAIKAVAKYGTCSESLWPYDIGKFKQKPGLTAYRDAQKHQALTYERISERLEDMKDCLARGFPFVFGFAVYSSFESPVVAKTGVMTMPANESVVGAHAVLAVGYLDGPETITIRGEQVTLKNVFIVQNSWSDKWGDGGYFYMPYEYATNPNLADDRWAINTVE